MYIFNAFYLLHSYNPSYTLSGIYRIDPEDRQGGFGVHCDQETVIRRPKRVVSFRGQKKAWATPRSVSFRALIQNFPGASPPLSYAEFRKISKMATASKLSGGV